MQTWSLKKHLLVIVILFLIPFTLLILSLASTTDIVSAGLGVMLIGSFAILFTIQFSIITSVVRKLAILRSSVTKRKIFLTYFLTSLLLIILVPFEIGLIEKIHFSKQLAEINKETIAATAEARNKFQIKDFSGK